MPQELLLMFPPEVSGARLRGPSMMWECCIPMLLHISPPQSQPFTNGMKMRRSGNTIAESLLLRKAHSPLWFIHLLVDLALRQSAITRGLLRWSPGNEMEEYHHVINHIRTKIGFALLRSVLIALRGERGIRTLSMKPLASTGFNMIPESIMNASSQWCSAP